MFRIIKAVCSLLLLTTLNLNAAPNVIEAPQALKQWRGWVVHQYPELNCSQGPENIRRNCHWHSALNVEVSTGQITFSQQHILEKQGWIELPGDTDSWPSVVRVNGYPENIMRHNQQPALYLAPGEHLIEGSISISEVPLSLKLPSSSTFVNLTIDGKEISQASVDNQSLLLNQVKVKVAKASDSLNVQVYRLLRDGYPLWLESKIEVNVSGERRIETLGRVLPAGFELTDIRSKLPLRIDAQGNMQVQLDAGRHVIHLQARLVDSVEQFKVEAHKNWPDQELWSFAPNRSYRIVDLQGTPIDGGQTNMPDRWKAFSSYLLTPEQGLTLIEKSRGDVNPDQHQLRLDRQLWLSFKGDNFTSQEQISGSMGYLDRLSAGANYSAGRISINRSPVLLTTVEGDQGVEVLPGPINIDSVGIVQGHDIAINPWSSELNDATLQVNLPPGYRMFAVSGADSVSNDYLSSWNLWEIFIVILFVVVLCKQYGLAAGAVGLLYALTINNIEGAPGIILLLLIIGLHFVVNVLAQNKIRAVLTRIYQLGLVLLLLSFLPFAIEQARLAIYPQLEKPYLMDSSDYRDDQQISYEMQQDQIEMPSALQESKKIVREKIRTMKQQAASGSMLPAPAPRYQKRYQEGEVVQTGPGMPSWRWNRVDISVSGPVVVGQSIQLIITPPWVNRTLNLLRIILFVLLAYLLWRRHSFNDPSTGSVDKDSKTEEQPNASSGPAASASILLVAALVIYSGINSSNLLAADFPPQQLLQEYYQRLNEAPQCHPNCVAINRLNIQASESELVLDMHVATLAKVPLRLPLSVVDTRSVQVTVNGEAANFLSHYRGRAYLLLGKGLHRVQLRLGATDLSQLQLQFDNIPQLTRYTGEGWQVSGIHKQAVPSGRISLRKLKKQPVTETEKRLTANPIQSLVKVTRVLSLDVDWSLTTTVSRVAPSRGAINLAVELLPGESVTTAGVKVKNNKVLVDLGQNSTSTSWRSDLQKSSPVTLIATDSQDYFEVWQLNPSLKWHVSHRGIKPIKSNAANLIWQPVAGDQLTISLQKPEPLAGVSYSIDGVTMGYQPGKRLANTVLELDFRASKGSDYPLQLPKQADISSIRLNGNSIIYVQEEGAVILPIPPGKSRFVVEFSQGDELQLVTHTPVLAIPGATNIKIETSMPGNRWVLAVSGPLIGPAILFWGVLLMILAIGFILGRQAWSPLKSWEWMLMGSGIATSFWPITLLVVLWFAALAKRSSLVNTQTSARKFNLLQVAIALLTFVMLLALVGSVANSLMFGSPDMQVTGNGSYATSLNWYQDAISNNLPETTVISVPMWSYQVLMLLWSIWLSMSLIRWLKWGWNNYSNDGLWKALPKAAKKDQREAKKAQRAKEKKQDDPW
ncbi:MAG: hypothetical protein MJK10_15795 [Pseudomonadales bacterium]|nr:hypothetical protein [Pseudomonadales bacterium]NRA17532.1 hypothetical protein [Oceanospirillaceae bacterium]